MGSWASRAVFSLSGPVLGHSAEEEYFQRSRLDFILFSFNVMTHAFDSDSLLNGTPFHGSSIAAKVVPKSFLFVCVSSIAMVSGDTM